MIYPKSLNNLIESFQQLPGIGEKTAERLAFFVLNMDKEKVDNFSNSLIMARNNLGKCQVCGFISEGQTCELCQSKIRNKEILCVVEDSKSVVLFEKIGTYNGLYHVLGGLISPIDGIGPDDINIGSLVKRIENNNFKEIIMALKPGIEGETTVLYLTKILSGFNLVISRIAYGVPIGADMEYVDALTLATALENRTNIE